MKGVNVLSGLTKSNSIWSGCCLSRTACTHRVSTARHSDRIVIMDEGRIIEVGSHDELVARGGQYAELERIQREGADESDYHALGVT